MSGSVFSWRWVALPGLVVGNVALQFIVAGSDAGYALGIAAGPLFWGCVGGGISWLVRKRKPATFSSTFFWTALIMAALMFAGSIARL